MKLTKEQIRRKVRGMHKKEQAIFIFLNSSDNADHKISEIIGVKTARVTKWISDYCKENFKPKAE